MRRGSRITIKDVARQAGVSVQTVSRVINNRRDVSRETRLRVQQVIAELGYAPNVIARSLIQGRSNTLGVVGYGLVYFGSTRVLTGVERRANELGFSLLLSLLDQFEPHRVNDIVGQLLARQVDGIIWAVPGQVDAPGWLQDRLDQLPVPAVFLNRPQSAGDVVVAIDNQHGARLATEHLLAHNYRRVGIITGPAAWWETQERRRGWHQAMQAAGIENLAALEVGGDWSAASGEAGLHTLYAQSPDLDAVFASNDQMALGALQAARQLGLRVPQDLGVVGFDDIPEAAFFYPSLTTVRQPAVELGALAVDQMVHFIQAQRNEQPFSAPVACVTPNLIVRKSSIR